MILKGGLIIKNKKALTKTSCRDKIRLFKQTLKRAKTKFVNYWFGCVYIHKDYVYDVDGTKKLYTFSIIVDRRGKGQWFSQLDANDIQKLIKIIKNNKSKHFLLHVKLGCSAYQEYTFNKRQTKLLLQQLEQMIEEEIYTE